MKFSTREDIGASAEEVFVAVTDFAGFERAALRRGAEVQRIDRLTQPAVGMSWSGRFPYRGKTRKAVLDLTDYTPNERLGLHALSDALDITMALSLLALSRTRTRLGVELEIRPRTLAARVLLQSARLGKGSLDKRFQARVRGFATDLERRQPHRQAGP
jgi:hypothetical protein